MEARMPRNAIRERPLRAQGWLQLPGGNLSTLPMLRLLIVGGLCGILWLYVLYYVIA
jgi:hypothetical protein